MHMHGSTTAHGTLKRLWTLHHHHGWSWGASPIRTCPRNTMYGGRSSTMGGSRPYRSWYFCPASLSYITTEFCTPHSSYYNIIQTTTTSYKLLQHHTSYRNIIQATTTSYKLLQHHTSYYNIIQATTTSYKLLQHNTIY